MRSVLTLIVVGAFSFLVGCGSSGGSTPVGVPTPTPAGQNITPITVDGGPAGVGYVNGAFVSVEICLPSTSTCQTIDHVLLDTGSFGLRLLASEVTINPPIINDGSSGDTLNDCVQFLDNSFLWGQVASADVKMAGEVASATPVQLIATPTGYLIPTGCTGTNEDTQATLGANGILGVGPEPFDCGEGCDAADVQPGTQAPPVYYLCSTANGCTATFVSCGAICNDTSANAQVTNPVFNFTSDNNGVIVELPAVNGTAASLSGSLIFGIGTQTNNALGSASVLQLNDLDNFTTVFSGQTLSESFIDSGSNSYAFPNGIESNFTGGNIPICTTNSDFYCPASLTAFSATNESGSVNSAVNFSVDNADNLFSQNPSDFVFVNLAAPQGSGPCTGTTGACTFDWGLPFFYGRNVYTAIDAVTPPTGVPAGPFEAY